MGLRMAVATEDFGHPLRQAIRLAAQNPVQGLRLNARSEVKASEFTETGLRQLRHYVAEHQMQVAGLYYPSRHALADPQSLDQRLDGYTPPGLVVSVSDFLFEALSSDRSRAMADLQ